MISLTQGNVALVDDDDYTRLSPVKWYAWKSHAGQNRANSIKRANHRSPFKGVTWHRRGWYSQIVSNGKHYYLGTFLTQFEAARAYDIAAKALHGEFARTNF